jgi:phosphopantetheine adenylyltransferase
MLKGLMRRNLMPHFYHGSLKNIPNDPIKHFSKFKFPEARRAHAHASVKGLRKVEHFQQLEWRMNVKT